LKGMTEPSVKPQKRPNDGPMDRSNLKLILAAAIGFVMVEFTIQELVGESDQASAFMSEIFLCFLICVLMVIVKNTKWLQRDASADSKDSPAVAAQSSVAKKSKDKPLPPWRKESPNSSDTEKGESNAMARGLVKLNAPWRQPAGTNEKVFWKAQHAKDSDAEDSGDENKKAAVKKEQSESWTDRVNALKPEKSQAQQQGQLMETTQDGLQALLATWKGFTPQGLKQQHTIERFGKKLRCITLTDAKEKGAPPVESQYNLIVLNDGKTVSWGSSGNIILDATKVAEGKITWLNKKGPNWQWHLCNEGAESV